MRGRALLPTLWAAVIATAAVFQAQPHALAQANTPPSQGVSRGENFSAKPAPALFASDCTGGGCHRGPQGLAKGRGQAGLASFLREHYTNSRESAAALANYLLGVPGSAPGESRSSTRQPQTPAGRGSRAAARPDDDTPAAQPPHRRGAEPAEPPKPAPPARAAARPDDDSPQAAPASPSPPAAAPATPPGRERRTAEPAPTPAKPTARDRRGRQTTAAPAPEPTPPPAAAPPPPQQFDIFD